MDLKKPATVGTMESSDIMITLRPNLGMGIEIELQSNVKALYGDAIEQTIRNVLEEFCVKDAYISAIDKGALDCVIRARMECVICRAAEVSYDWGKDDCNG